MTVQSEIIENTEKKEIKFPVLKMLKDCGDVVMFTTKGKGIVVVGRTYSLGHCSEIWIDCGQQPAT